MKIVIWTLIFLAALTPAVLYFFQRWRQSQAEKKGVVVYATVVSIAPIKKFGKVLPMKKIVMSIQEPEKERRTVTLRTQIADGQTIVPGMLLSVVVDPKNPKRIYPAGPEAAKRVVMTGPRRDRRQMRSGRGVQRGAGAGRRRS
jgi:hypothetical protein